MSPITLVLFAVGVAGCFAMTAVASYYPDSSEYINYGIVVITIALLVLAAFLMERRKKAS